MRRRKEKKTRKTLLYWKMKRTCSICRQMKAWEAVSFINDIFEWKYENKSNRANISLKHPTFSR